ncbi:hypothetical protein [Haloarchaeobius sp. TZWWS8]|uniref:hypothetical protein n=1 Tax=Haloarchaeobius sp. TZWWS8 TaxID=3446121 RepID=UPI003EBDDDBF
MVLLTLALVLTVGAIRVGFVYEGATDDPVSATWVVDVSDLSAADRAAVARARAGETLVYRSPEAAPGPGRGTIAVFADDSWHVFRRPIYVDFGTPFGLGAALSAVVGLVCLLTPVVRQFRD